MKNLTFKQKLGGVVLAILALFGVGVSTDTVNLGSNTIGSEYIATSTRSSVGANNLANLVVLTSTDGCSSTCPGTLGSVVITGANTGIVRFWDATTTNVNLRVGATSTLTFVELPASLAAGTYTFDMNFNKGIIYELVSGTNAPTSTVTWRHR